MTHRWIKCLIIAAGFLALPANAYAENIVALFTPSLDFEGGGQRNEFANSIAKILTQQTGEKWEGRAFARADDFESNKDKVAVAILDAEYFTSKGGNFKPAAMLTASGKTKRPLKLIAKSGGSSKLYSYQNKRLALISNTSQAGAFFSASVLGHETKASSYFSSIDDVRDVRSAITAVEMGKADLALVFDGYDSKFTSIYTTAPVGLPVIAVNENNILPAQLDSVKNALKNMSVHTSFISGSAPYSAADAAAYKNIAASKRSNALTYRPIEPDNPRIGGVSALQFNKRDTGIELNPFQVHFAPSVSEFDKKLELRL